MSGDVIDLIRSRENEFVFYDDFSMPSYMTGQELTKLARVEMKDDAIEINYGINRAFDGLVKIEGEQSDIRDWMTFFEAYDNGDTNNMHRYCEKATAFRIPDIKIVEKDSILKYHKFMFWSFINHQVRGKEIVLIDPDIMTVHIAVRNAQDYSFKVYYTSADSYDIYMANKEDFWFKPILIEELDIYDLKDDHVNAVFYFGLKLILYDYEQYEFDYYGYLLNPDHPSVAYHGIDNYMCGRYYDSRLHSEVVIPENVITESLEDVYSKDVHEKYKEYKGLYVLLRKYPTRLFAETRPATHVIIDPYYLCGSLEYRDEEVEYEGKTYVVRSNQYGAYDINVRGFFGNKIAMLRKMGRGIAWVDQSCPTFVTHTFSIACSEFDTMIYVYEGLTESASPEINAFYTYENITHTFTMEDYGMLEETISDTDDSLRIAFALAPNYGYYKEYYNDRRVVSTDFLLLKPSPTGRLKYKYTLIENFKFPVGQHGSKWYLTQSIPYDLPFGYVLSWKDDAVSTIQINSWQNIAFDSYYDSLDLDLEE